MSKFEEMCKALEAAQERWVEHKDRCLNHISSLSTDFMRYCEFPAGHLRFIPANNYDINKEYFPVEAIQFEPDGYWHWGWALKIAGRNVVVRLALREFADKVAVKRLWDREAQSLELEDRVACEKFYDGIIDRITTYFGQKPEDVGMEYSGQEQIGFKIE